MGLCILYSDIESAVINNGFATDWIKPSTGVTYPEIADI